LESPNWLLQWDSRGRQTFFTAEQVGWDAQQNFKSEEISSQF